MIYRNRILLSYGATFAPIAELIRRKKEKNQSPNRVFLFKRLYFQSESDLLVEEIVLTLLPIIANYCRLLPIYCQFIADYGHPLPRERRFMVNGSQVTGRRS
jgi:hypothetical protein